MEDGTDGGYDGTVTINLGHISALCQVQVDSSSISTSITGFHGDYSEWAWTIPLSFPRDKLEPDRHGGEVVGEL
jgi:hypothetical protein